MFANDQRLIDYASMLLSALAWVPSSQKQGITSGKDSLK